MSTCLSHFQVLLAIHTAFFVFLCVRVEIHDTSVLQDEHNPCSSAETKVVQLRDEDVPRNRLTSTWCGVETILMITHPQCVVVIIMG
jgi:hypothetical protein